MDKKTRPTHMMPPREPPQIERYTETKSKGIKKDISCKWKGEKSWGSNTYICQNRIQNKGYKKRPRRTFHNIQGKNQSRTHKHYTHVCTQHWSTQIYKENLGGLRERYRQQHTHSRGF